jgi:hypothetical protein
VKWEAILPTLLARHVRWDFVELGLWLGLYPSDRSAFHHNLDTTVTFLILLVLLKSNKWSEFNIFGSSPI